MIGSLLRFIHKPIYEKRIDILSNLIVMHIQSGDKILDIGCGFGMLGKAILSHHKCPRGVIYRGLEKARRGGEHVEVIEHKAGRLPFEDSEFDVVILADVLHHEQQEDFLLSEAVRVARRILVVKDHKPEGLLSFWRISFLDWAANNPHEVECLYRYHTKAEWRQLFSSHNLIPVVEETSIDLYPPFFNLFFGKQLQYFVVLQRIKEAEHGRPLDGAIVAPLS